MSISEEANIESGYKRSAKVGTYLSFFVNLLLFLVKLIAAIISGSMVLIASTLDSALDLLSGFIILLTSKAARIENVYFFPVGKTRFEPLGIVVFASCMFTLTTQILVSSIRILLAGEDEWEIDIGYFSLGTLLGTVVIKMILFLYCRRSTVAVVRTLARDHLNDIITNSFGFVAVLISYKYVWFLDALGALLLSFYIMYIWACTGVQTAKMLTGVSAPNEFLSQLTYLCWNFSEKILAIDTIRAFHVSEGYYAEVDIVLPPNMSLRESHDIGEALQMRIEKLPCVERAHVHTDYESEHSPEHRKLV